MIEQDARSLRARRPLPELGLRSESVFLPQVVSFQLAGGVVLFLFGLQMIFGSGVANGQAAAEPDHDLVLGSTGSNLLIRVMGLAALAAEQVVAGVEQLALGRPTVLS